MFATIISLLSDEQNTHTRGNISVTSRVSESFPHL